MKLDKLLSTWDLKARWADLRTIVNTHSGVVAGIGVAATAVGTVLCCKATLKADAKAAEHQSKIIDARNKKASGDKKAVRKAYTGIAKDYFRIYIAGAATWGVGIALLLKSRGIEVAKNKELTAAYIALESAFNSYREKVKQQLGEEEEAKIFNSTMTENKNLVCDKRFSGVDGSIFIFNESSYEFEPKQPRSNSIVLIAVTGTLNSKLNRNKIVYLNDLMRAVGHKELVNGWDWAWIKTEPGTNQIDFGLSDRTLNQDFINGTDPVAKLRLSGLRHISCAYNEGILDDGKSSTCEIGCGPCIIN